MFQAWPKAILRGALIFPAFTLTGQAQAPALTETLTPAERAWLARTQSKAKVVACD